MAPTQTANSSLPSTSEDMSSTSSAVTSTVNTTTSAETHSCPYNECNKSFSKKYNLKAHLRLHTGEEPFECDRPDCRKKFKWRSSLSSHSVWHTRKDNANNGSQPNRTSKSCSPSSKPSCPQKTCSSRPVRVAPHPSAQRVNMNPSSVSACVSSAGYRKKRPRSEMSGSLLDSTTESLEVEHSRLSGCSRIRTKSTRSAAKKRRARAPTSGKPVPVSKAKPDVGEASRTRTQEEDVFAAPGSPVTSDGSNSEPGLDLDEFPCDILQPLLDTHDDEVGTMIGAEDGQLFGYEESGSYVPLSGFDSRFEQFDLDNFANFYLNKMEGL